MDPSTFLQQFPFVPPEELCRLHRTGLRAALIDLWRAVRRLLFSR